MTREDIIRMAREAGFTMSEHGRSASQVFRMFTNFAQLVAAAERENWPEEMKAMERQVEILSDELANAKSATRKETMEEMIYAHPTTAIKKAVAIEREACAVIAEEMFCGCGRGNCPEEDARAHEIANAIRARGQQ